MFEVGIALKHQHGEQNVFDLSLGNPVMEPPEQFREELRRWTSSATPGMHRYMPNLGYAETRAAVAAQLAAETGLNFTMNEVVMSCGAAGGLNVVLKTLLDEGDEVIIFAPYFAEYIYYIDNHSGVCKVVPCDERFNPDLDALEAAITPKTKAVLINSPNNPSGAVYEPELLHDLGALLRQKEAQFGTSIYLIGDQAYRKLVFDGLECPHVFPFHPRSIAVASHSKDLALPGERIGYIAVHPECNELAELIDGFAFCTRTLGFVNAPALMQHVVRGLQNVTIDITEYQRKRDFLYYHLTKMGYSVVRPRGAFYMFPKSPIADDVAFVKELQERLVLTVPGKGFGSPGYFRISYCVTDETIEGSLPGFRQVARKFGLC
jgi:aspartate aminotransferase